jgi:hypothetical protein
MIMELALAIALGALVLIGAASARPLKRWIKKCKRRRGGVYLWRVDHHRNRARRVNGYVGETVSFYLRSRQHMGVSRFDPVTGQVVKGKGSGMATVKIPAQPWSDLNPKRYDVIKLPWWLCWKWVLRPLETLVMLLTWPVYNDAKNRWNPRRIPKSIAAAQRQAREYGRGVAYTTRVTLAHGARIAVQLGGAALVVVGTYGWIVTR